MPHRRRKFAVNKTTVKGNLTQQNDTTNPQLCSSNEIPHQSHETKAENSNTLKQNKKKHCSIDTGNKTMRNKKNCNTNALQNEDSKLVEKTQEQIIIANDKRVDDHSTHATSTETRRDNTETRRDKIRHAHRIKIRSPNRQSLHILKQTTKIEINKDQLTERNTTRNNDVDAIDSNKDNIKIAFLNCINVNVNIPEKVTRIENMNTIDKEPEKASNTLNISENNNTESFNETNYVSNNVSQSSTAEVLIDDDGDPFTIINVTSNQPEDMCRICHGGNNSSAEVGRLLSVCSCRGTVGRVHVKCLERWLTESGKSSCELCGTRYLTRRVHRYGVPKAMLMWLLSPNSKQMIVDGLGIVLMSPLAVLSAWLTGRALSGLIRDDLSTWPLASTFVLACMTLVCYYCWVVSAATRHALGWWIWYRSQYIVRLQLDENQE